MGVHNAYGEKLIRMGFLSPRELAGLIIDAYKNGELDDLIARNSVTLKVYPVHPSTQAVPQTIELVTSTIWEVEDWIDKLLRQGYVLSDEKNRPSVEEFLIFEIRNAFPDTIDNARSKLPRGYEWLSPGNDLR